MTPEPEETSPLCHRIITNTDDGETAKPDAAALSPRLQALPACGSGWSRALHTKLPTSGAPSLWLRMEQGLHTKPDRSSQGICCLVWPVYLSGDFQTFFHQKTSLRIKNNLRRMK